MNKGFTLILVLLCIIGSTIVSSIDELSYTFKSLFYGITALIIIIIGLVEIHKYLRKNKTEGS